MRDATIAYFGYGSLVNLSSLQTPYVDAFCASVEGWERVWLPRPGGTIVPGGPVDMAFLSVRPSKGTVIDGMVIRDHAASLPALDKRETLYERRTLVGDDIVYARSGPQLLPEGVFLYVAEPGTDALAGTHYILRSYLDVVFQGFLEHFGEDGLARFVATTANFHFPVHEDRRAPLYTRAVELSCEQVRLFDNLVPHGGFDCQAN